MLRFEKCVPSRVLFTASLANLCPQHICRIAGVADTTVLEVSLWGQVSGHVDRSKAGYFDNIFLPQVVDKIITCVMISNAAAGRKMTNKCNKRTDLYTNSSLTASVLLLLDSKIFM